MEVIGIFLLGLLDGFLLHQRVTKKQYKNSIWLRKERENILGGLK